MAEQKHENRQINVEGLIDKIDYGMSEYYKTFQLNYTNADGKGKFQEFIEVNGFDDIDVSDELAANPQDCTLVDFDEQFPLNPKIEDNAKRFEEIVRILNCVALCGYFKPKQEYKKLDLSIIDDISDNEIENAIEKYAAQMHCFATLAVKDKDLKYFLGIGHKQGFPFLTFMVDSFTKDKVIYYVKTKGLLTVTQWAKENKFMKALREHNVKKAISLEHAMNSYCSRIMNRLRFDAAVYSIKDNLQQITEYIVATAVFVQKCMDKLNGKAPFQVDLLIAVNGVETTVPNNRTHVNEMKDVSDDDDEEDDTDIKSTDPNLDQIGYVQEKLKDFPLYFAPTESELWDIDDAKRSVDAITRTLSERYAAFRTVLRKFQFDDNDNDDEKKENNFEKFRFDEKTYPQNKRFEIFVDRRLNKPTNKGKDNDENRDQMTYFQPPDDCNSMDNDHVPEIGFELIRKCIIPQKVQNKEQHITAMDGLCGQLLTFMFNVEQKDEVRCYIVWNGQTMRFHGEHLRQVLPLLFEKNEENVKFVNSKEGLKMEQMFGNVVNDAHFDPFYAELISFE